MSRNQTPGGHWRKAAAFAGASALGGLLAGAALGATGSVIPEPFRLAIGTVAFFALVVVGVVEAQGRRLRLPQRNKETPQRWIHAGPLQWAMRNGFSLGLGFTSRLGFWLWYVIPLVAVVVGDVWLSAVLYATYGATRGLTAVAIFGYALQRPGWDYGNWLLARAALVGRAGSYVLAVVAASLVIQLGFLSG